MDLTLVRHAYLPEVTLGRLTLGDLRLATLEEPWLPNPKGPGGMRRRDGRESCVPDGNYKLTPHNGTLFKNVYRLSNPDLGVYDFEDEIPAIANSGRAYVLIHSGNTTADILGCILVGMVHGTLDGQASVLRSREALNKLRGIMLNEQHTLTIRPTAGAV